MDINTIQQKRKTDVKSSLISYTNTSTLKHSPQDIKKQQHKNQLQLYRKHNTNNRKQNTKTTKNNMDKLNARVTAEQQKKTNVP